MRSFLTIIAVLAILCTPIESRAEPPVLYELLIRPQLDQIWATCGQPGGLRVYYPATLELEASYPINGTPYGMAFSSDGLYLYLGINDPDAGMSYVRCYASSTGQQVSQSNVAGIVMGVICHSNGDVYAVSQNPAADYGYLERFSPISLTLQGTIETGAWPAACESPLDGSILVGTLRAEMGEPPDPWLYSRILRLDPTDLSVLEEIHAGLQPVRFIPAGGKLLIENMGLELGPPGFESLINGLTVYDLQNGSTTFEWFTFPDAVRGSCYEPVTGKWFGWTFDLRQGSTSSSSRLWMICDPDDPQPAVIHEFPDRQILVAVAYPSNSSTIRLVGIDKVSEELFAYETSANAPPVGRFDPVPPAGQAPLTVNFLNYSSDCDGNIVEIQADWNNDGITDETFQGSPGIIEHEFVDPGIYEVKLTVVDDDGATDDWEASIPVIE